jgi:hypothetical protein
MRERLSDVLRGGGRARDSRNRRRRTEAQAQVFLCPAGANCRNQFVVGAHIKSPKNKSPGERLIRGFDWQIRKALESLPNEFERLGQIHRQAVAGWRTQSHAREARSGVDVVDDGFHWQKIVGQKFPSAYCPSNMGGLARVKMPVWRTNNMLRYTFLAFSVGGTQLKNCSGPDS